MSEKKSSQKETYQVHPIGTVRRNGDEIRLEIDEAFRPGLKQLEHDQNLPVT